MESVKFLGIYSGNLPSLNESRLRMPMDRQYWHIWFNQKEQNYIAQALNKSRMPINAPYTISVLLFSLNFIEEKNIDFQQPKLPNMSTLKNYEEEATQKNANEHKEERAKNNQRDEQNLSVKNTDQEIKTLTEKANNIAQTKNATDKTNQITHVQNMYPPVKQKENKHEKINLEEENPEEEKLLLPKKAFDDKIQNIRAKRIDINFRSDFASAILLWEKGKKGAASARFHNLLKKNDAFIKAHKHMFTDCAIKLRKIHQNNLALTFAIRCTDLSPEDSHTYFNVGRLYYELREYKPSGSYLEKALELEPELPPALKLYEIVSNILTRVTRTHEK